MQHVKNISVNTATNGAINSNIPGNLNNELRQIATGGEENNGKPVLYTGEMTEFGEITTIDRFAGIIEGLLGRDREPSTVPIADKILLTLKEAQALTGLSSEFLRSSIVAGTLKAKKIGNSWRLKRSDVDEYVASLF